MIVKELGRSGLKKWWLQEAPTPIQFIEHGGGVSTFGYSPLPTPDSSAWTNIGDARPPRLGSNAQIGDRIGIVAGQMVTPSGRMIWLLEYGRAGESSDV